MKGPLNRYTNKILSELGALCIRGVRIRIYEINKKNERTTNDAKEFFSMRIVDDLLVRRA